MVDRQEGRQPDRSLFPGMERLIAFRLLLVVIFLGSAIVLELKEAPPFPTAPLFIIIGLTFFLSFLYALLLPRLPALVPFCGFQLIADLLVSVVLVHYTGGIESPFTFLFVLPILAAAMLLSREGALFIASVGAILYGLLIDFEFYGLVQPAAYAVASKAYVAPAYVLFRSFINISAFFLVAVLSSHLSERLREARERIAQQATDIRNLESLYQDMIANIPSGIMTVDRSGRVISFNDAASRITGHPEAEVVGHPAAEVGFPVDLTEAFMGWAGERPGAGSPAEFRYCRRDGGTIPLGIGIAPLKDADGRVLGLVAIFQDLTDKKRMEEELRRSDRLAAMGRLAAQIAHEIRNPLAAISGSIQLLRREKQAGMSDDRLLEIVVREAERLKLITGQFLEQVRPAGSGAQVCNLGETIEETLTLLRQTSEADHRWRIRYTASPKPLLVLADRDRLKQVFWNIGLNALQAMPDGGELTVRVRAEVEQGVVEFCDVGAGIPQEDLEKIFDPFYTTKSGGTGLGLSIAREIVKDLGGRIEVESQPGRGATFRVLLLRAEGSDVAQPAAASVSSVRGKR